MENPVDIRRDRFQGCLIGQCLGDALGYAVVNQPSKQGDESADMAVADVLHAANYGQYTDASQLARELMLTLMGYEGTDAHDEFYTTRVQLHLESWEYRGFDPDTLAKRMQALALDNRLFGKDSTTTDACSQLLNGIDWFAAGADASDENNGSAARAAPIGLFFWNKTSAIISAAFLQSIITHRSRRCVAGAIAIAGAVALNLRQADLTNEFTDTLRDWVKIYDPTLALGIELLQEWRTLSPHAAYDKICNHCSSTPSQLQSPEGKYFSDGIVTESVLWSLYAFLKTPKNHLTAIKTAISSGPDVINTAAMTGAVSGAHLGLLNMDLPAGMANKLTDRGNWGYDALLNLAANTCAASERRYDGLGFMAQLCTNSVTSQ